MGGIEREIDSLGRIVIPIEYRRKLGIGASSRVLVSLSDDEIRICASNRCCALCRAKIDDREIRLCDECMEKVRDYKL